MLYEASLSVTDASGRQISLLNSDSVNAQTNVRTTPSTTAKHPPAHWQSHQRSDDNDSASQQQQQQQQRQSRRKYHCSEPGCNKSFTTSGHLARHNRIHTGEKNFPCLFPGCQSRFSRQDNMMQHYRTHMSPKSRRLHKRPAAGPAEEPRPRPRLHAHHRIRSDTYGVEPPLTIDQHLSNYHRSLVTISADTPSPARQDDQRSSSSPAASGDDLLSSSTQEQPVPRPSTQVSPATAAANSMPPETTTFYRHKPLTISTDSSSKKLPFTLLHPTLKSSSPKAKDKDEQSDRDNRASLYQLAHIVSTFG